MATLQRRSLDSLPTELILEICSFIREPDWIGHKKAKCSSLLEELNQELQTVEEAQEGQSDLAALALTCRRLLPIVQPSLYAEAAILAEDGFGTRFRFRQFCNTLRKKPHLAETVKNVQIANLAIAGMSGDVGDALDQVFLPMVPNLESISIWTTEAWPSGPPGTDPASYTASAPVPPKLKTLFIRGQESFSSVTLNTRLFQGGWLSQIETLDLRQIEEVGWILETLSEEQPPQHSSQHVFPNLRTLRLQQDNIGLDHFGDLLEHVGPGLEHVSIGVRRASSEDQLAEDTFHPRAYIDIQQTVTALLPY